MRLLIPLFRHFFSFFSICMLLLCGCALPEASGGVSACAPSPSPSLLASPSPSVLPSASPSAAAPLSLGSKGPEVSRLQARLIELGYLCINEPTGTFGEKTAAAVLWFQKRNSLPSDSDGVAREATLSLLEPEASCVKSLSGFVIGLDPGHQEKGDSSQEPVSPGSSVTKKKVSSGTQGRFTKVPEYRVTLTVALALRELLEQYGATVVMTRDRNDVNLSNVERAKFFNEKETDYALRLHCNGSNDASVCGAFMLVPKANPFLSDCEIASKLLIESYCRRTGLKNLGVTPRGDQTGFNWCKRMIVNIEMGHMSNETEDHLLVDSAFQQKMARGLAEGILAYFSQREV